MTTTQTTNQLANIPHPAGATLVDDWYDPRLPFGAAPPTVGPDADRYFRGGSWVIERNNHDTDICLQVDGIQHADGRVERVITVADGNTEALDPFTPQLARQLARALIAAADEAEQMNGYDEVTISN